jgi:hypothetical protein
MVRRQNQLIEPADLNAKLGNVFRFNLGICQSGLTHLTET